MGQGIVVGRGGGSVYLSIQSCLNWGEYFIFFFCEVPTILTVLLIETILVVKGQTCPHRYPAEFSWLVAPELSSWFYTNVKVNELFSTPFQEQMSAL